jgi:hypothetical protein
MAKTVLASAVAFTTCHLAVEHNGAQVVLSDIDATRWTLTPEIARAAASRITIDAVMPVALYGVPLPVIQWDDFSQETGIPVVIDAAAAIEVQEIPRLGFVAQNLMDGSNAKMSEYHAAVGLAQIERWSRIKRLRHASNFDHSTFEQRCSRSNRRRRACRTNGPRTPEHAAHCDCRRGHRPQPGACRIRCCCSSTDTPDGCVPGRASTSALASRPHVTPFESTAPFSAHPPRL